MQNTKKLRNRFTVCWDRWRKRRIDVVMMTETCKMAGTIQAAEIDVAINKIILNVYSERMVESAEFAVKCPISDIGLYLHLKIREIFKCQIDTYDLFVKQKL